MVAIPTGTSERSREESACPGVGRGFGGAVTIADPLMNRWSVRMFGRETFKLGTFRLGIFRPGTFRKELRL
jgi:hypothetical protein